MNCDINIEKLKNAEKFVKTLAMTGEFLYIALIYEPIDCAYCWRYPVINWYIYYFCARRRGEKRLADALLAKDNVRAVYNSTVSGFTSENGAVTGVKIHDAAAGQDSTFAVEGVFVAIGLAPATGFLKDTGLLDEYGYVKADESCRTAMEGVFVAGDCRTKSVRQITTAAADGATAALAACAQVS